MLGGIQAVTIGTLAWRMRQLQVNESEHYRLLAEENRIATRLVAPVRGLIFDRNGVLIAQNQQNYRVVIVREQAGDVAEVLEELGIGLRRDGRVLHAVARAREAVDEPEAHESVALEAAQADILLEVATAGGRGQHGEGVDERCPAGGRKCALKARGRLGASRTTGKECAE